MNVVPRLSSVFFLLIAVVAFVVPSFVSADVSVLDNVCGQTLTSQNTTDEHARAIYVSPASSAAFDRVTFWATRNEVAVTYTWTAYVFFDYTYGDELELANADYTSNSVNMTASMDPQEISLDFSTLISYSIVDNFTILLVPTGDYTRLNAVTLKYADADCGGVTSEIYHGTFVDDVWQPWEQNGHGYFELRDTGTLSADLRVVTPCSGTKGTISDCYTATTTTADISGFVTTQGEFALNIQTRSIDGMQALDSVMLAYTEATTSMMFSETLDIASSTTYLVSVCVTGIGMFTFDYGGNNCVVLRVANGLTTEQFGSILTDLGIYVEPVGKDTAWQSYECDDIGITDVKKGVVCAGIFLFYPDTASLNAFLTSAANVAHIYPIGYGAVIAEEFLAARNATSTIWDKDINVGAWFGVATSTISVDVTSAVTGENTWWQPLVDKVDFFLWAAFVGWLLFWGLTRKL